MDAKQNQLEHFTKFWIELDVFRMYASGETQDIDNNQAIDVQSITVRTIFSFDNYANILIHHIKNLNQLCLQLHPEFTCGYVKTRTDEKH